MSTTSFTLLSILVISSISLLALVFLAIAPNRLQSIITTLVAFAIGGLLGEVFIHLIPDINDSIGWDLSVSLIFLGGLLFNLIVDSIAHATHSHSSHTPHHHDSAHHDEHVSHDAIHINEEPEDDKSPLLAQENMSSETSPRGAYGSGLESPISEDAPSEGFLEAASKRAFTRVKHHAQAPAPAASLYPTPVANNGQIQKSDVPHPQKTTTIISSRQSSSSPDTISPRQHPVVQPPKKVATFVYSIIIANALHNVVDGVCVAAGFLTSNRAGITISIASALHEIPHELGDAAVLMLGGLSLNRALLINCLTSLTSFLGAIATLAIGERFQSQIQYLLPFAAGSFLYVSLQLLPELRADRNNSKFRAFMQYMAIIAGGSIMGLLLLIE